jgi:hypothetical protein
MNRYIRKTTLNKNDMIKIGLIPFEDQIEIFKQRAMNNYHKLEIERNPQRYRGSQIKEIQNPIHKEYNTRISKKEQQLLEQLKKEEQIKETKMKLRKR